MSRSKRRSPRNRRKPSGPVASLWSDAGYTPSAPEPIRPTPDPAAVARSLGEPPLTPDTAAELHLAAVYEEAVRAATALAAANGLLEQTEPDETSV